VLAAVLNRLANLALDQPCGGAADADLAIATSKAVLLVLYFMHVRHSSKLTWRAIVAGIFIFLTLILMTLSDYVSRSWGNWWGRGRLKAFSLWGGEPLPLCCLWPCNCPISGL
jgi:caa(3)-type oxidase subunit IV